MCEKTRILAHPSTHSKHLITSRMPWFSIEDKLGPLPPVVPTVVAAEGGREVAAAAVESRLEETESRSLEMSSSSQADRARTAF